MTDDDLSARWAPTLLRVDATDRHTPTQEATLDADLPFTSGNEAWEDAVAAATGDGPHTGVMVAFYPTPAQQQELAVEGGEDPGELHLTLAFLGEVGAELQPQDEATVIAAVTAWASAQSPVAAATNGHGIFAGGPTPVTYASINAPALPAARQCLVEGLDAAGVAPVQTYGYVPHLTLAYDERRDVQVPSMDLLFDVVVVAFAGNQTRIPLGPAAQPAAQPVSTHTAFLHGAGVLQVSAGVLQVTERPTAGTDMSAAPVVIDPVVESSTAFVSDINGRTLITAPATTIAAMKDPTLEDITAQHMLWMHGRFVGAEAPNRNGAFWSAGDLQMAKGSVAHGPLNWLHDARHVIGTLAKADYVDPTAQMHGRSGQGAQRADAGTALPHITATAAIWKWIYPDEAYVVQQASEQQMLWYSMECISKEVSCVGEAGCGNTTSYADYMAGAACEHVRQRASVRRFVDPVFLGGAVIVPPTRPGWAEADARVMNTANALAEAAFEQAGRPDISTSDWEQVMGQLVRFAQN